MNKSAKVVLEAIAAQPLPEMAGVGIRWHANIEQSSVQCMAALRVISIMLNQGVCEDYCLDGHVLWDNER